ncbi:MAG TPA: aspartate--tRNA(Asn) ligase [Micromonosporaceae bacterium]
MERILSIQLTGRVGETVRLAGWVHRRRSLKDVAFLILRDASGLAQIVVDDERRPRLDAVPEETPISVTGRVIENPVAPRGVEIVEPDIVALSDAAEPPPFDLYRPRIAASLPTMLDHAPVALRHPRLAAVHRIGAAALAGFRAALDARSFVEICTPKIVGTATESGANLFRVDYFGATAYLAQSPQLYKQVMVGVFERVYEVGRVFRAEPSDTGRHLAEFTSLDAEMGFVTDHREVMAACRDAVAGMVDAVWRRAPHDVELLGVERPALPDEVPVVDFRDALSMYSSATGHDAMSEKDLSPAHERFIGEWARAEHGSDFVFVDGYPTASRAFYTHPDPERPGRSRGFDLIFRGLELVSGAQRLHRYEDYVATLAARGETDLAPFAGYLDAMRHGMPPHGGFAFGLERFLARLVGAANVREVTLFPRDVHRLAP